MAGVVLRLNDPVAQSPLLAGGKGANLAKMTRSGLPVPSGFVISTDAFRTVVGDLSLKSLQKIKPTAQKTLQSASQKICNFILNRDLPEDLVSQIQDAYQALGKSTVSVRSSATVEDMKDASFAGQYDSFLNVTSLKGLIHSLKQVWASLYTPHAIAYCKQNRISLETVQMAVVVQQQLIPDSAGVLFTQDPITGSEQWIVNAAPGLGEGVVAGVAQADRFVLQPKDGHLLSAEVVPKRKKVVANKRSGIKTVSVAAQERGKPALTKAQLKKLSGLTQQVVDLFGDHLDIEFALVGRKIYMLQARPITGSVVEPDEDWDASIDGKYSWKLRRNRTIPMYRLEEDVRVDYAANQKICFQEAGSAMAANYITQIVNGYFYERAPRISKKRLEKIHVRQRRRIDAYLRKGISYFEGAMQPIIEDRLAELKAQRARARDLSDLVAYLDACIQANGYIMGNLHWAQIRPGSFSQMGFSDQYHQLTGRPAEESYVFLQAIQNRMTRLVAWLQKLARMAQGNAVLSKRLAERRFDAFLEPQAQANPAVGAFRDEFKRMLRIYGLRTGMGYGSTSGFTTPTWNMDLSLPLEIIASYAEQDLDRLAELEHQARRDRQNAVKRVRRLLAPTPRKLKQFNEALDNAISRVRLLENHNYWMEQCTIGTLREAIFEVGTALVQENVIENPDDIIHLSMKELKAISKAPADQRELIHRRTEMYERRKRMRPPVTLGKVLAQKEPDPPDKEEEKRGLQGNIIQGVSASGGQVTGPARVVLPGKKRPKVRSGDILVANNVGPEWTPVFALIGGLVLDEGAVYQHAALVAREYGIPAVLHAKDASSIITEGQTIGVDGDSGVVELALTPSEGA